MTNTTNILRTTTRKIAASFAAAAISLSVSWGAHAQAQNHVIQNFNQVPGGSQALNRMKMAQDRRVSIRKKRLSKNTRKILNGKSSAGKLVRTKGNTALKTRKKIKKVKKFKKPPTKALKGILKRPGAPKANKHVKFNTKPLSKGSKYRPTRHVKSKHVKFPGKSTKALHKTSKSAKAARNAAKARQAAKVLKTAKAAKLAVAGTGVGAAVSIGASMAGLDPVEMATLKATNPAEYNRRMRDLKKNPVKYVGKNVANNTKKAAQNVGKAGKKVGCGVGNVFKKKGKKKKC